MDDLPVGAGPSVNIATSSTLTTTTDGTTRESCHRDVIVIGAGWSGLASCKYMLEEGLSVITLEKRDNIGGVWLYTDDPTTPSVMKTTQCTSSSTVTEMSDYPMPEGIGMFPHHTDVLEYLHAYVKEFNLQPHIRLNTTVEGVERTGEGWRVSCSRGGRVYTSSYLVVATGVVQCPNRELENTTLKGFTGTILHACEVKQPLEEFRDKRLLLLGGGETGSDICLDWHDHASMIFWSIPRGQHFFRKYAKVVPWGNPQALDKASSRLMKTIAPYHRSKPGLSWVCKWTSNGSLLAYQGHGIPEWKNNAYFFQFFINKNGKVLDLIDYERLVPKGGITHCEGKQVTFIDGTTQEFDLVIMSTGYNVQYPYLPERYSSVGIRHRHKMVFDMEDPTLAFVGLVRPIVGSIVGISELQARWAAKIFAKKIPLKTLDERKEDIKQDIAHWSSYFKHTSQRIEGLVEGFTYIDDIAHHAGIFPDYWSLLKSNPRQWLVAITAPYNASTYRLNEKDKRDQAIATMKSHQKVTLGPLQYMLIIFMRFIWFDWWLDRISSVKHWCQTSSWWPTVRSWRVTKGLNYLWTRPKKLCFDTVSDDRDEMSPRAKTLMRTHLAKLKLAKPASSTTTTTTLSTTSESNGTSKLRNTRTTNGINTHMTNGTLPTTTQLQKRQ